MSQAAACGPRCGSCCGSCAKFLDDPRAFEAALPGLSALSSAYGSVRAETGLCLLHDDLRLPTQGCGQWRPRSAETGPNQDETSK